MRLQQLTWQVLALIFFLIPIPLKAQEMNSLPVGTWVMIDDVTGAENLLNIRDNGEYEIDLGVDEVIDLWGTYTVSGDQIFFLTAEGDLAEHCPNQGVYNFTVNSNNLTYEMIADECVLRRTLNGFPWIKVEVMRSEGPVLRV